MNIDIVNGAFELTAGFFVLASCRRGAGGVSPITVAFFTTWGVFRLFFYPAVGCPVSLVGGVMVTAANAFWLVLLLRRRTR